MMIMTMDLTLALAVEFDMGLTKRDTLPTQNPKCGGLPSNQQQHKILSHLEKQDQSHCQSSLTIQYHRVIPLRPISLHSHHVHWHPSLHHRHPVPSLHILCHLALHQYQTDIIRTESVKNPNKTTKTIDHMLNQIT